MELIKDDELIEQLKRALKEGVVTADRLYVAVNNGQITLIEYLLSTKDFQK